MASWRICSTELRAPAAPLGPPRNGPPGRAELPRCSFEKGREHDHVVLVGPGRGVEGTATGDQPKLCPVSRPVDEFGREVVLRVAGHPVHDELRRPSVGADDLDDVAALHGAEVEEDRRPTVAGVDVPHHNGVADLTGAWSSSYQPASRGLSSGGTTSSPRSFKPTGTISASTPIRGTFTRNGWERGIPAGLGDGAGLGRGVAVAVGLLSRRVRSALVPPPSPEAADALGVLGAAEAVGEAGAEGAGEGSSGEGVSRNGGAAAGSGCGGYSGSGSLSASPINPTPASMNIVTRMRPAARHGNPWRPLALLAASGDRAIG